VRTFRKVINQMELNVLLLPYNVLNTVSILKETSIIVIMH